MDIHYSLVETLKQSKDLLTSESQKYHNLFVEEHLDRFAKTLLLFNENTPESFPKPHFNVECTPPLKESFSYFEVAVKQFVSAPNDTQQNAVDFAKSIDVVPFQNILILLGQRLTPASIMDETAIPPTHKELMQSAMEEGKQNLSVAARAWAKHVNRHPDNFWGSISGSAKQKNQGVKKILLHIINNTTWWNIFFHYKHELVYEARVASGHGVRWGQKGKTFIGFLEPFLEEEF